MARSLPTPPFVAAGFWRLTVAVSLCGVAVSVAQPTGGTVAGRVLDATKESLPGVSVTLLPEREGAARRTSTDRDGRYRFDDVPADTYRIDFALGGFDGARVDQLRVQPGATAGADAMLRVGIMCDCARSRGTPVGDQPAPLEGQVLDDAGRPVPNATLELVTFKGRETAFTDREGRFLVRAPIEGAWSIRAFDSGFEPVTREMSGNKDGPVMFRLPYAGTRDVASTERLARMCRCFGDSFAHVDR